MPDNSAQIAHLESILNAGVKTVTIDGLSTTYDFDEIRKRLAELRATDDSATNKRPPFYRVRLPYV